MNDLDQNSKSPFSLFPKIIGFRLYLVAFLAFLVSLFETLAISMIAPLVSGADAADGFANRFYIESLYIIEKIYFFGIDNIKVKILCCLVFLFYLKSIGTFWVGHSIAVLKADFLITIRNKILSRLLDMSVVEVSSQSSTFYSNLLIDQADRSVVSLGFFIQAITKYLAAVLYLSFSLILAPQFGIITLTACASVVVGFRVISKQVSAISRNFAKQNSILSTLISDVIQNLKYLTVTKQKNGTFIFRTFFNISSVGNLQKKISTKEALTMSARDALIITLLAVVLLPKLSAGSDISVNLVSILLMYRSMSAILMAQKVLQSSQEYFGSFLHLHKFLPEYVKRTSTKPETVIVLEDNIWDELRLTNVSKKFSDRCVLDNVNLVLERGNFLCIMGQSGVGKTTLLDIALSVTEPTAGRVDFYFKNEIKPDVINKIGYVTQAKDLFQGTVLENITMWEREYDLDNVIDLVQELRLTGNDPICESFLNKRVETLSGGEQQRVALARELYRGVDILALDEPTSALDAENRDILISIIKSLKGKVTVIAVTHDKKFASESDQLLYIRSNEY